MWRRAWKWRHLFCSVRVGDNQAVTCRGWPSSGGKKEVSLLPVFWVGKTSSSPLSFLLLISLLAVTHHKPSCYNVCLWYGEHNRSFAWDGLAWWLSRGVFRCIVCSGACVDLNTKIPVWEHWQGSVCCSSSMQQIAYFILHFCHCWEGICFATLDSTTATALPA